MTKKELLKKLIPISEIKFPIIKYDDNGNQIYHENSNGYWEKKEYDDKGNQIYYEDAGGYWYKYKYDDKGNQIYYEDSQGDWWEIIDNKKVEYKDKKYFIDDIEYKLINK